MLFGVLRMPMQSAMSDELSRMQFYQRAQQAADRIEELEAQLARASQQVPEGWKLVPIQPTIEMVKAAQFHTEHDDDVERGDPKNYRAKGQALAVWHEMIAAAPAGGETGEG
jgi:hypothetical protein